ncbi:MAG: FAD-binding protein, partial [Boseongicola sp.]|nr:FAD-binding protein [Boseongicola sp.]
MTPANETDLAEAVKSATGPLAIRGGGTRTVGRASDAQVLSVSEMSAISLYEPGALTLVAEAGTPLEEIETALSAENQMLAFEPMDHRPLLGTEGRPTIGGVVAANVSGPRRVQAGACRDFLLGVRFVDGAGSVVKNGGRVMKNVTGYDLAKLMAGSRGTLGVLTEVSLKVLPRPDTAAAVLLTGLSNKDAVRAMSEAMKSPFEVTGAAHVPVGLDGDPVTMIRIEGFEESV